MSECRWVQRVEQWLDGAAPEPEAVERHVATCPSCAALRARLLRVRDGVRAVAVRQEIGSGQFDAFYAGIRDRVDAPAPTRWRGIWALASLGAAALLVAVSIFAISSGGPAPVQAHTTVESATSDIEGALIETQDSSERDSAIVWVHVPHGDVW